MDNGAPVRGNSDEFNFGNSGWRKSSYSMSNGQCVETTARLVGGCVGVRDSTAAEGPVLRFGPGTWATFLGQLRTSTHVKA